MARNKKFVTVYTITLEGVTTNGFSSQVYDEVLRSIVLAINSQSQQITAKIDANYVMGEFKREQSSETVANNTL